MAMADEGNSIRVYIPTICITVLGSIYLIMGHNSVGFTLIVTTIAALGGYLIPSPMQQKKKY